MKNKELKYYFCIVIVIVLYLYLYNRFPDEDVSKIITTCTALISAVAFWLQFKRSERLNESSFIMNMNNQFISNEDMTQVEHELELYYNQFEELIKNQKSQDLTLKNVEKIHLGLSQSRTSEDCQKLINYLVYLESMAVLVDRQVIHIDVMDDLFSYRFFLAVNNPIVQEGELYPYAEFYNGIFKLSQYWTKIHKIKGIPIPMEQFSLSLKKRKSWKRENSKDLFHISTARGDDKKIEIANCLYHTDSYIYPEAFGENEIQASKAISRIIGMDGSLLDYNKFLVARYNGEVCGICLISDGKGKWERDKITKRIGSDYMPERIREGFVHASIDYFEKFYEENPDENCIELVAFCVHDGFRRKHIGSALLDELIKTYSTRDIYLDVLKRNDAAINLYKSKGFIKIGDIFEGFAPEGLKKPECIRMVHKAKVIKNQN